MSSPSFGSRLAVDSALLTACWLLFLMLLGRDLGAEPAIAEATEPIVFEGNVIGYESSDPNVAFLRPDRWALVHNRAFLEPAADAVVSLYFVAEPRYDAAARYVAQIAETEPGKVVLPLPHVLDRSELFLSDLAGHVAAEVSPNPLLNQSPLLYYRLAFDTVGLEAMRELARGGASLLGNVDITYSIRGEPQRSSVPIAIRLTESALSPRERPADYGIEWVMGLVSEHDLDLDGLLDGVYPLGLLSVEITRSTVAGSFDMERTSFRKEGTDIIVTASGVNFSARGRFHVVETDTDVTFDADMRLSLRLSLATMNVAVEAMEADSIAADDPALADFMVGFINRIIATKRTRGDMGERVTQELRRRVLTGSLFLD